MPTPADEVKAPIVACIVMLRDVMVSLVPCSEAPAQVEALIVGVHALIITPRDSMVPYRIAQVTKMC